MATIEDALEEGDEMMLRDFIGDLRYEYDYIVIDTPPGKAMLAINALSAADEVIITLQTERAALDGVNDIIKFTHDIVFHYNDSLKIRGILPTMYRKGTTHTAGILKRARQLWSEHVFPIEIPNTIEFSRSYEQRQPIIMSNPRHPGAHAYIQFARLVHGLPLLNDLAENEDHIAVAEPADTVDETSQDTENTEQGIQENMPNI